MYELYSIIISIYIIVFKLKNLKYILYTCLIIKIFIFYYLCFIPNNYIFNNFFYNLLN